MERPSAYFIGFVFSRNGSSANVLGYFEKFLSARRMHLFHQFETAVEKNPRLFSEVSFAIKIVG